MSGINVVIFYAERIFEAANIGMEPQFSAMILGFINLGELIFH
jgi:hypothetical protein